MAIPDDEPASRGVVLEGPVISRRIARYRTCRYEVRRGRDGVIPDIAEAVASPRLLTDDGERARRVLDLVDSVPALIWGRDELGTGDMWNSNSVVAWLLARSDLGAEAIRPPVRGGGPRGRGGGGAARPEAGGSPSLGALGGARLPPPPAGGAPPAAGPAWSRLAGLLESRAELRDRRQHRRRRAPALHLIQQLPRGVLDATQARELDDGDPLGGRVVVGHDRDLSGTGVTTLPSG